MLDIKDTKCQAALTLSVAWSYPFTNLLASQGPDLFLEGYTIM